MTTTVHFTQIDIGQAVAARIDSIADALAEYRESGELQIDIPASALFYLEALGYMVDFTTGMVTREYESTTHCECEVVATP
jgi:hypothetical protein